MTTTIARDEWVQAHKVLSGALTHLCRDEAPSDARATFQAISILLHARETVLR